MTPIFLLIFDIVILGIIMIPYFRKFKRNNLGMCGTGLKYSDKRGI